jgi:CRISPR/Cas system-associated endonuclease Cas1
MAKSATTKLLVFFQMKRKLLVKQVKHYSSNIKRLKISRELIGAALHNVLRNLRYRDSRGVELLKETEAVQTEVLRLTEGEGLLHKWKKARLATASDSEREVIELRNKDSGSRDFRLFGTAFKAD